MLYLALQSQALERNLIVNKIFEATSTNGRWGVDVFTPSADFIAHEQSLSDRHLVLQGHLEDKGKSVKRRVFVFTPDPNADTFYLFGDDVVALEAAKTVYTEGLQSNAYVTIIAMGPQAIVKEYGYKRRSAETYLYINGRIRDSGSILVALGLVEAEGAQEVPAPPEPSTHFAELLRDTGL